MSTIKRTGSKPPAPSTSKRSSVASCGPTTPNKRAAAACGGSACGGWVGRATRGKSEKAARAARKSLDTAACGSSPPKRNAGTVSSCGGAGWTRWGKLPSGC